MDPTDASTIPISSPIRIALRNFASEWFLVPQGTGILAVVLHQLDFQFSGLHIISYIFWILTIILLFIFTLFYLLRCVVFPKHVVAALRQGAGEIVCLASLSISFTSIIQMMALTLVNQWGRGWGIAAYVLWWVNLGMALLGSIAIPFVVIRLYPPTLAQLSPATQLEFIAALTAAAGGSTICQYADISSDLQVPVVVVSYLLIGVGLPLSFALDTLFVARLMNHSFPSPIHTFQDMILCGPWGQGSFALQGLGQVVLRIGSAGYGGGLFGESRATDPIAYASMFAGLLSWGAGTFWWVFAIFSILHTAFDHNQRKGLRFGLANWSVVFPWGVYTNAAIQLGKLLDSTAFRVWSTALAIMLVVILLANMCLTVKGVISGSMLGLNHGWTSPNIGYRRERREV